MKRKSWHTLPASACPLTRSVSLRRGPVNAVRFADGNIVASSSGDGSTKVWNLETGQETAEAVPEGLFSEERGAQEQIVNGHVVSAKGQTLCVLKAADGKAETAPVAFFQCASKIKAFDVAGANVAVGCADGEVLQLFAAVLQTRV